MGQSLSTRSQPSGHTSAPRSHHSKRPRRRDSAVDVDRTSTKSVHWDNTATQGSSSFGARPHLNVLREASGNAERPKRHSKSRRAESSIEVDPIKEGQRRPRKSDTSKATGKTKAHHSTPRASKSSVHQKQSVETKECVICTDARSLSRFPDRPPTEQCAHGGDACRRCLRTWIQSEFSTKIWNEINCPICAGRMQYDDIREFAPKEVFRRYDKLSTKAAYDAIPNYRWCLTKNCKSGQVLQPGTFKFRCKRCKKSHCVQHNVLWHKGETCQQYDYRMDKSIKREEEAASKKVLLETTKRCPGCKRNIEKSYGCDHMTCSKCKHEFCWQCLAAYAKKGVRRCIHRQGCVYYDPTVEPD